ncbi:hypothetical protein H3146_24395 [Streptomyces sp. OF3]|uniref:DUF4352 domain-containing protein n=1 Tax=Streptomyces alkaliterrae TaxID=2213162 RepID=A0A7W3ZQ68_9ACTN|nr:hypothetical protein [Streptomyces alkaliterrae]MBB1256468.1 hypothetical protein [Streptomyces alkaliterrae]
MALLVPYGGGLPRAREVVMRIRVAAASAAVLLLAACGGADKPDDKAAPAKSPTPTESVDCADESLDQAEWMEHCADGSGTGGDGGAFTDLKFGTEYTWPDGLKVSVLEARKFSDYGEFEEATPGELDFRLKVRFTNTSKQPISLSDVSTYIEGATKGGEAAGTEFERGAQPITGRLASGVTATFTDDGVLEERYGRDIVVKVQRMQADDDQADPEFVGRIK